MQNTISYLREIEINGVTFLLDLRFQQIFDLISPEFIEDAADLNKLFLQDLSVINKSLDAIIKRNYSDDVAMCFFVMMCMQNCDQLKKAGNFITSVYKQHPHDLLAKCAYANQLYFEEKADEIIGVFGNTFDLDKVCTERVLPLITFIHFMSLACDYYFDRQDARNFLKYLAYLIEVAPDDSMVQNHLNNFFEVFKS